MICKICGNKDLRKLYFLQNYQIWRCPACGFGQVDITPEELTSFYDKAYFQGETARFGQEADQDILPSHGYWLEQQIKVLGGEKPLKILDIGPGISAGFGKYVARHYPHMSYEAVEISAYAADSMKARGYVVHQGRCADPEILDNCRGRFDLIVGTEVIEHDPEPHQFMGAVSQMLKPGGRCAFTTGNLNGGVARYKKAAWYYLDPPAHVSYYTPRAAQILFKAHGLVRTSVLKTGFNYINLKLKTRLPGIITLAHLLSLPTGMSIHAHRRND